MRCHTAPNTFPRRRGGNLFKIIRRRKQHGFREWGYENGRFTYRFTIPEGTSARVEFPLIDPQPLTLNGKPATQFTRIGGVAVAELPAGRYVLQ